MNEKYKFGNPVIDRQRSSVEEFCSTPQNDLYFHIQSYYPNLKPTENVSLDQFDPLVKKTIDSNIEKWQQIEDAIPKNLSGSAFDAGCGICTLSWRLRDQFNWVCGDYDSQKILLARKYLDDKLNNALTLNLHDLPFKNNTFDLITNIDVIEHIDNKKKVLSEFHRVLKPGGHLYIHTDNALRITLAVKARRLMQLFKGQRLDWNPAWEGIEDGHNHLITLNDMSHLLEQSKFKVIKGRYLAGGPFPFIAAKFFYLLVQKV